MQNNNQVSDPAKTPTKTENGLALNLHDSRKRTKDQLGFFNGMDQARNNLPAEECPDFLGENRPLRIQHHQSEINRCIAHQNEKLTLELADRLDRHTKWVEAALMEAMAKKMREKREELRRMGKINWLLQEKVRALCAENQAWKQVAQTHEAAANSLRHELGSLICKVMDDPISNVGGGAGVIKEDRASSCGSNNYGREKRLRSG